MDRTLVDKNMPRTFAQAAAVTVLTVLGIDVAAEFFPDNVRLRVAKAAFHVGNDAFEGVSSPPGPSASGAEIGEENLVTAAAI